MTMLVVTPSCAPDFSRFRRLHTSLTEHCPVDVRHCAIVPRCDVRMFSAIGSPRLTVLSEAEVLPPNIVPTTRLARLPLVPRGFRIAALNLTKPWPPVRGWILQQLLKLAFVRTLDVDVALIIDSDVMIVRDLTEDDFVHADVVRHYRLPYGITQTMERHITWRETAAKLLGLESPSIDAADYVAGIVSWSPAVVRRMLARIENVSSRPWESVIASQMDLSEFVLYGEFLAAFGTAAEKSFTSDRTLCHSRWDTSPLTLAAAERFVTSMAVDDVAIHVQSNSGTSEATLEYIAEAVRHS